MFYGCEILEKLDISSFITDNATNMNYLFYNCKKLSKIDLSNFNTNGITNLDAMFYHCQNLSELDLRNIQITDKQENSRFGNLLSNCEILVSSKEIKDWLLSANSSFSNIKIMDFEGNIIEDN